MLPLGQKVSPNASLAPMLALEQAFARRTHGLPGDALGVLVVFNGAFDPLLMHHVALGIVRKMPKRRIKFLSLHQKHMRGRASVVSRVPNATVAVLSKLEIAELKQPFVRAGPDPRIEVAF